MYQMYQMEKVEQAGRNIKYMYFLLYCNLCIQFLVRKKLANLFSFASGSQDVTKSNFNQTR